MSRIFRIAAVAVVAFAVAGAPVASDAASRDRRRPSLRYRTAQDAVLVGTGSSSDGLPTEITGTATDSGRGIRRVRVWAIPCDIQHSATSCSYHGIWTEHHRPGRVAVSCTSRSRRSCTWRAPAPVAPGWYWVAAEAEDFAGNVSRGSAILRVLVV